MGHPWRADHSKARDVPGVSFHDVADATAEMVRQMADNGQVKKNSFHPDAGLNADLIGKGVAIAAAIP